MIFYKFLKQLFGVSYLRYEFQVKPSKTNFYYSSQSYDAYQMIKIKLLLLHCNL